MKNTDDLKVMSSLGKFVLANENIRRNCQHFIQTVLHSGTKKESTRNKE